MVQVQVRVYGLLRDRITFPRGHLPHRPFPVTLTAVSPTVYDLLHHLEINEGLITSTAVNGQTGDLTAPLQDGDQVSLFPPTAGG